MLQPPRVSSSRTFSDDLLNLLSQPQRHSPKRLERAKSFLQVGTNLLDSASASEGTN